MNSSTDVDYEYLSVTVTNDGTRFYTCSYDENRVSPLINNMENYVLQVVNFTIPSQSIPLFNYETPITATFGIRYTNIANITTGVPLLFTKNVVLTDGTVGVGGNPQTLSSNNNQSYGTVFNQLPTAVFSVQVFVNAMNRCLVQLFNDLTTSPDLIAPITPNVPRITYNETDGFFMFSADNDYDINDVSYNYITITCNDFVKSLLFGFPMYNDTSLPVPFQHQFLFFNTSSGVAPVVYDMITQGSPINYWISAKKIIVTSNKLKINPESTSSNLNPGGRSITKNVISDYNISTLNTITDFYTPITFTQFNDKQNLIVMQGYGNIYEFDFEFFYVDNLGRTYPIVLFFGQSFTIKFKFQKYR